MASVSRAGRESRARVRLRARRTSHGATSGRVTSRTPPPTSTTCSARPPRVQPLAQHVDQLLRLADRWQLEDLAQPLQLDRTLRCEQQRLQDIDGIRHALPPPAAVSAPSGSSGAASGGVRPPPASGGGFTLTAWRSMTISPKSSACRARAWPRRTSSSKASRVTTHSARTRSAPATDENRMDHVWRRRSRISPIRSRMDTGFASISRGARTRCASTSRFIARTRRCTDRSSRGTSSGGGSSLPGRPKQRACSASRPPSHAPIALTRAYSRTRSASSRRRASPSSSTSAAASSSGRGSRSFDLR